MFRRVVGNELWHVLPNRQDNADCMVASLLRIISFQAFAQEMQVHAHNGIGLRIEAGSTAKGIHRDAVLLEVSGGSVKIFFANILENTRELRRSLKQMGGENCVQLCTFFVESVVLITDNGGTRHLKYPD